MMKYLELILCKLVWLRTKTDINWLDTKFRFRKWPHWIDRTDCVMNIAAMMSLFLAGIVLPCIYIFFGLNYIIFLITPLIIYSVTERLLSKHFTRKAKTCRIIFNKEYMQSKWGVVLTILFFLIPFLPIIVIVILHLLGFIR